MKKSFNYTHLFLRILGIMVAIWPALYSGFPLVTPDSGTYISSGVSLSVPMDRPIGYGVFVLLSSLKVSLWWVILAQGIIFTLLIRWLSKKILGEKVKESTLTLIIIVISFATSAAWFNAQLMADAFSGMLLIALILLFLERQDKKKVLILSLIILFFLLVHTSHILIVLAFCVLTGIYFFRKKQKELLALSKRLLAISIFSILILSTINLIKFKTFGLSPVSHMFMISRMVEEGLVDKFLAKQCPIEHYSLCDYQGKLGDRQWDFMWMGDFPHTKENGWMNTKKEYNRIIYGILKDPRLLGLYMVKTTEGTVRQLFQVYVGDGLTPQGEGSPPYNVIDSYFKHQLKEYKSSFQMLQLLPITFFNQMSILLSLSFCCLALFLFNKKTSVFNSTETITYDDWKLIFNVVILFLILNAFVTATFSTVIARLQSRVFWVLPTLCLLFIVHYYFNKKSRKETN